MRTTKPASSIFSLTRMLKSRRATLERHDEDVAAVENRNRHQVEQAEVQADHRHEVGERNPAELRGFARQLRDGDRPHQLLGRCLARDQTPHRLKDQSRALNVLLHTELDGLCDGRVQASHLVAGRDTEIPHLAVLARRDSEGERRPVSKYRQADRLIRTLGDDRPEIAIERDWFSVRSDDDIPRLEAAARAGLVGAHPEETGVHVGQHADVAELEAALADGGRRRRDPACQGLAVAHEIDRDFALRTRAHPHQEIVPPLHGIAGDRQNSVADADVGSFRRGTRRDDADNRRVTFERGHLAVAIEDDGRQHNGQQQVHHRTHDQHLKALPFGLRHEFVVAAGAFLFRGSRRPSSRSRRAAARRSRIRCRRDGS